MKDEDVGPVPVVNNTNDKRVVGIVTDRDIALEVVAAGRDPNSTRIEEIMTRRLVTCHTDDDAHDALEAMGRHQVRRIPVVDSHDRLVGIIAQADLARQMDEVEVGEVLEDISQPARSAMGRTFGRVARTVQGFRGATETARVLVAAGVGMATGATLMCLFDPTRGRDRRARVSSAARTAYDQSTNLMNKAGRRIGQFRSQSGRPGESGEQKFLASEPIGL
jgi:CBS-domain-containing membrane protein